MNSKSKKLAPITDEEIQAYLAEMEAVDYDGMLDWEEESLYFYWEVGDHSESYKVVEL